MRPENVIIIYQSEMERFNKTREIQWKFNLVFWGMLTLGIEKSNELFYFNWFILLTFSILFTLGYWMFIYKVQHSLEVSKNITNHIVYSLNDSLENNIELNLKLISAKTLIGKNGTIWIIFQTFVTVSLLIILLYLSK